MSENGTSISTTLPCMSGKKSTGTIPAGFGFTYTYDKTLGKDALDKKIAEAYARLIKDLNLKANKVCVGSCSKNCTPMGIDANALIGITVTDTAVPSPPAPNNNWRIITVAGTAGVDYVIDFTCDCNEVNSTTSAPTTPSTTAP